MLEPGVVLFYLYNSGLVKRFPHDGKFTMNFCEDVDFNVDKVYNIKRNIENKYVQ